MSLGRFLNVTDEGVSPSVSNLVLMEPIDLFV